MRSGENGQVMIVTDHGNAGHAGKHAEDAWHALAAAAGGAGRSGDLLDELSRGRPWLPMVNGELGFIADRLSICLPG
jgi:hypothetical protein